MICPDCGKKMKLTKDDGDYKVLSCSCGCWIEIMGKLADNMVV
jgi:hypothetical protein